MLVSAGVLVITIPKSESASTKSANLTSIIQSTFRHLKQNNVVVILLGSTSLISAFLTSLKFLLAGYYIIYAIDQGWVGFLYSGILITDVIGTLLLPRLVNKLLLIPGYCSNTLA
jgi:hypothetical protein